MLVSEIILAARTDYLDDAVVPYTWDDLALIRHFNNIYNEWCKETSCLRDFTTEAICKIPILSNKHTYAMDSRIVEVLNGYMEFNLIGSSQVSVKSTPWLDENVSGWRFDTGNLDYLLPDYNTGYIRVVRYPDDTVGYWDGAVTFVSSTKTISHTGGLFSSLLEAGDKVVVSATTLNGTTAVPKTFTVVTVASDSFTVSEIVVDEVAASAIVQKVVDNLWLSVIRLPLTQITINNYTTESPETRVDYHYKLIDGICREAYKKIDSQAYDPKRSAEHGAIFENNKQKAKYETQGLRIDKNATMKPKRGAL